MRHNILHLLKRCEGVKEKEELENEGGGHTRLAPHMGVQPHFHNQEEGAITGRYEKRRERKMKGRVYMPSTRHSRPRRTHGCTSECSGVPQKKRCERETLRAVGAECSVSPLKKGNKKIRARRALNIQNLG